MSLDFGYRMISRFLNETPLQYRTPWSEAIGKVHPHFGMDTIAHLVPRSAMQMYTDESPLKL